MVIKNIFRSKKLRLYMDEGFDEPYVIEWTGGKVYDTYKSLRSAKAQYHHLVKINR